ncbi:MAG: hypothetical protein R3185_08075, partial [Candidatus Thermoplasmatota archaeon]|nr:hypothetical protein [Candidatus Thermoplasmatota archaeon]
MEGNSPASTPAHDRTPIPSSAVPTDQPGLTRSLELGETLGGFLSTLTLETLGPVDHRDVQAVVRKAAGVASYGGLGLWALATLLTSPRGQAVGEAVAGL